MPARTEKRRSSLAQICDFRRMAAYTYTEQEAYVGRIQDAVRACEKLRLRASFATKTALPYEVKSAIVLEDQAQFHPRKFALAIAKAISAKDSKVFDSTRATDVREVGAAVVVETQYGKIAAQQTSEW